ncbi:MAG: hypothetical protein ACYTG7_25935, partial [Planctomycetota bacterium]
MGRYMNVPRILVDTGRLPDGNIGWPWAIWMALGLAIQKSVPLALFISYSGVILSCLGIIALASRFLASPRIGLVAAAIFTLMPLTMHQSYADLKLDMGLLFLLILTAWSLFQWRARNFEDRWLLLAGIFMGTAIAVKITAVFAVFAFVALIALWRLGWSGFFLALLAEVTFCLLAYGRMIPDLPLRHSRMLGWIFGAALVLLFIFLLIRQRAKLRSLLPAILFLLAGAAVALLPWMAKGFHETDSLSPLEMIQGQEESVPVDLKSLGIDPLKEQATGTREELTRYIGYDRSIAHFLALPWQMTMNTTVQGYYVDISFLFLAFLPAGGLLFLLGRKRYTWNGQWIALVLLAIVSWGFWAALSYGVPWYNLFGFLPLALLAAGAFRLMLEYKGLHYVAALMLVV